MINLMHASRIIGKLHQMLFEIFVLQIEAENHCTSQMRSLIDQISLQQGRIVALEGEIYLLKI